MSSVRASGVGFAFGDALPVFQDLDFHLPMGWTGLVGANGAGKSTLLRLLTRELVATEGFVHFEPDGARVTLCEQTIETPSPEVLALAEGLDAQAHRLFGQLGLNPWDITRWPTMSPGERKRWQIGAALWSDPHVLLLDEPTNHLDGPGREWLLASLGRFRGVGVVVSHDRALLDALTTQTLRLHRGRGQIWAGAYSAAKEHWEREAAGAAREREAVKRTVARTREQLHEARSDQQGANAQKSAGKRMRGPKDSDARGMGADFVVSTAEKRHGRRVEVVRRELERVEASLGEHGAEKEVGRSLFLRYERAPKPVLLELVSATLRAGDQVLAKKVSLSVEREARLHVQGPNGSGKSTLLQALIGAARISMDRLLYLPQEIAPEQAREELERVRALEPEEKGRVLSLVAALGVEPDQLLKSAQPSPGEARKLMLASGLGRHVWALVLDEPTNHLDLPAIERLESALQAFPGAVLLATHDAALAARVTSETVDVRKLGQR